MLTISELTQTRLAVFVAEAGSGKPVRRLPVYAEAVLAPGGDPLMDPDASVYRPPVLDDISTEDAVIADLMESAARERIPAQWVSTHDDRYVELLKQLYEQLRESFGEGAPPADAERRTRDELGTIAHQFEIPEPPTRANRSERAIPLGVLATDHVGFVSFDLERVDIPGLLSGADDEALNLAVDFRIYPGLLENRMVSVIAQNRIASDAIVARIEWAHA